MSITLSDLLARAEGTLPLPAAARLYAAVAADNDAGAYGGMGSTGTMSVVLEGGRDTVTAVVGGVHRYLVDVEDTDHAETVVRLCAVPGCPNDALSPGGLSRVCDDHIDAVTPLAASLGLDGSEARERRLAELEAGIAADAEKLDRRRSVLSKLHG